MKRKMRDILNPPECFHWLNPYKKVPYDLPRFFGLTSDPYEQQILESILFNFSSYPSFSKCIWLKDDKPRKFKTKEQLSSIRKKRLKSKLEKDVPLFANEIEQQELQSKKDFYDGVRDLPEEVVNETEPMSASNAIKWLLQKGIPEPDPNQLQIIEKMNREREIFQRRMKEFRERVEARKKEEEKLKKIKEEQEKKKQEEELNNFELK